MNTTQFIEVPRFGEELIKMQAFARSFDHIINPGNNTRVFEFRKKDTTFGYADVIFIPVAFPAFHPEIATPRNVVETLQGWKSHCQIGYGGEGLLGVPLDGMVPTFPHSVIENAGFRKMKRELFSLVNQE